MVQDIANPFPISVISELLCVPKERHDEFRAWSHDLIGNTAASKKEITRSTLLLYRLFREVVSSALTASTDTLITRILAASDSRGGTLSLDEVVAFCVILLIAGSETTGNLLCNMISAFDSFGDQWSSVVHGHVPATFAVEEVLRFDAPTQGLDREVRQPISVAGVELPVGGRVRVLFGSANRDERWLSDANEFRVERQPTDHLAFGHGIHSCIGATLARLEATTLLEDLAGRGIRLRRCGRWQRLDHAVLRGFEAMPVEVTGSCGG